MTTPSQITMPGMATGLHSSLELRVTRNGYGLFATEPISRGTRVLCEDAFLSAPSKSSENIAKILEDLDTLTPDQLSAYTELTPGSYTYNKDIRQDLGEIMARKYPGIKKLAALDEKVADVAKLQNIWFNNSVGRGESAAIWCDTLEGYVGGVSTDYILRVHSVAVDVPCASIATCSKCGPGISVH